MKKIIANVIIGLVLLFCLALILYSVGYELIFKSYQLWGWLGLLSALISIVLIGSVVFAMINGINWAFRVLDEPVCNCPYCGKSMKGIELTHFKCKTCNEYFTN